MIDLLKFVFCMPLISGLKLHGDTGDRSFSSLI